MAKQSKKIEKNIKVNEDWKKKWENGKALMMRVTRRLQDRENCLTALESRLKASAGIIGALTVLSADVEKQSVCISKALIKEILEKYKVTSTETEDGMGYVIKVEEVKDNGVANKSNDETESSEIPQREDSN